MGGGASSYQGIVSISEEGRLFCECFEGITGVKSHRSQAWRALDSNNNGNVGLGETEQWIKTSLTDHIEDPERAYSVYSRFLPSYIMALEDATDATVDKPIKKEVPHIKQDQFQLFVAYLCIYALMLDAFKIFDIATDGSGLEDGEITKEKWIAKHSLLLRSPFIGLSAAGSSPEAADASFNEMDVNNTQCVLFPQFCFWVKKKEIQMGTGIGKFLSVGD